MNAIMTSPFLPLIITGIAFVAVVYLAMLFFGDRSEDLREIVDKYTGEGEVLREGRSNEGSFNERIASPLVNRLGSAFSGAAPAETRAKTAELLAMAGNPMSVSTFLALKTVALIALPLAYLAYVLLAGQPLALTQLVALVALAFIGRMLPTFILKKKITARQKAIERSIPDDVDLIVACVEAGLSLDGALMKVQESTEGPLADEIGIVLHEIRLGRQRRDALHDLAARTGVDTLRSISQSIAHAEQTGVSIADVLRTMADDMRVKRRFRAQEMAQKAPIKMLPVIAVFILPALFVVILGPAVITIKDTLMK